ncbi:MAG: hypothetical protein A3G34_07520 [Candidatus Lindowbacteria bacterium RIFCSPLOWO2_12_FULL_62_27]|nr:MAG: hypothetical protein A3G34_07520 [Candidatus Lindowbacteria bacterium RIFCSPLOWO2_12_FULL_62_27]OGH62281.1 MAG: hypothetical protein A3I06_05015 [Candidatus Lindowbacteria bacterium RIFCSPLOWO2_02_FULL_62_12]
MGYVLAIACCLSPLASQPSHAAQILNGTLADVQGDVKIRRAGSDLKRPASSGARVEPGDAVITGTSGRASIQFEHGKLGLANSTQMTLLRCMTSRDEVFAELALTAGSAEAYINMERRKELWFDILTPTQLARGEGNKKSATRLNVSHNAGGTTVTDSEVGRWRYQPIMLPDLPPAVQAVLTDNAKASARVKTYISAELSDSALTAYEVVSNAGAPDIAAVQTQTVPQTTPPIVAPAEKQSAPTPPAVLSAETSPMPVVPVAPSPVPAPEPLVISPAKSRVFSGAQITFKVQGGTGKRMFNLMPGGMEAGSTLDADGKYTAGVIGSGTQTDVVQVRDEANAVAEATVTVAAVLQLTAGINKVPSDMANPMRLQVMGGFAPYVYSISDNKSGGSVNEAGRYKPGKTGGVTDMITVTDDAGNKATVSIEVTAPAPLVPPKSTNTVKPKLESVTAQTVFVIGDKWTGNPTITYQWLRDGTSISGATAKTYTPTTDDAGRKVTCQVTATNEGGTSTEATEAIGILKIADPVLSGEPLVGSTLMVDGPGKWTGSSPITFTYKWIRDAHEISGATQASYKLTDADQGAKISCSVSAVNEAGTRYAGTEQVTVNAAPIKPALTGPLTISPASLRLFYGTSQTFTVTGGSGNLKFSMAANNSGGSVDQSGKYTAGKDIASVPEVDMIRVVDEANGAVFATVTVAAELQLTAPNNTIPADSANPMRLATVGGFPPFKCRYISRGRTGTSRTSRSNVWWAASDWRI